MEDQSLGGIVDNIDLTMESTVFNKEVLCSVGCEFVIIESDNSSIMDDASAHNKIETSSIIAPTNSINYQAGSEILKTPQFEVKNDAIYHAYISPCN